VSDAAPARRWPTLLMVAVVVVVAVYQAVAARYERAERKGDTLEIKVRLEELAERPCSR
jgi:hypothetical protein